LAKKDDNWLHSNDDNVSQLLKRDVDIREKYLKQELVMDPTEDLKYYFGKGITLEIDCQRNKFMGWCYCH
jgi:hypothetical protein